MSAEPSRPPDLRRNPAVRRYTVVCLAALVVLFLTMLDQGMDVWSLLPLLLGSLAVLLSWTSGPPLVLIAVAMLTYERWGNQLDGRRLVMLLTLRNPGRRTDWNFDDDFPVSDLILCVALLTYVVAQYRLLSLVRHVLPRDPRPPTAADGPAPPPSRRPADQVAPRELATMALSLPIWAALAYALWALLRGQYDGPLGLRGDVWRIVLLVWIAAAVLIGAAVVFGYLGWVRGSEEQARLYLQDQVWRETRREQARINHWMTAARLRRQRRDERP
jgi:hypothetical protein